MKVRSVVLTLALCVVGLAASFAQAPQMGTWKLNEAKSKLPAGMAKNSTVIYAAAGDMVKVTTDGFSGNGKPVQTEWTGKFDGKEYPLTGDPTADSRAYKMVSDHMLTLENKMGSKITSSGKIVVSRDGKSRTLTVSGTNAAGKKMTSVQVYDKQ